MGNNESKDMDGLITEMTTKILMLLSQRGADVDKQAVSRISLRLLQNNKERAIEYLRAELGDCSITVDEIERIYDETETERLNYYLMLSVQNEESGKTESKDLEFYQRKNLDTSTIRNSLSSFLDDASDESDGTEPIWKKDASRDDQDSRGKRLERIKRLQMDDPDDIS